MKSLGFIFKLKKNKIMLNWLFNRYVYIVFNKLYDYAFEGAFSSKRKAKAHILTLLDKDYTDETDYIIEKCQVF